MKAARPDDGDEKLQFQTGCLLLSMVRRFEAVTRRQSDVGAGGEQLKPSPDRDAQKQTHLVLESTSLELKRATKGVRG